MTPHILVVDDDKHICTILSEFIRRLGYSTLQAHNGAEALKIVTNPEGPSVGVVVTDFWMPSMSGVELLEEVHKLNPDIPVILISGAATRESAIAAVNAGAFKYLLKPYDRNQLAEAVRLALQKFGEAQSWHDIIAHYSELEKRANEQLETSRQMVVQSDELVSSLIYGLNHELGNVTQAIQINLAVLAEMDRNSDKSVDIREHLEDLRVSVEDLVALLSKLREYPQKGLQLQSLALGETLRPVLDSIQNKTRGRSLGIDITSPNKEVYVQGAALELRKAFEHVMDNAIEATEEHGGGKVELIVETEKDVARITVNDSGPGFRDDMLAQPFSPGNTTKLREGFVRGLGLGLFITRSLIELQGGTIHLSNHPRGGASVQINLPLVKAGG